MTADTHPLHIVHVISGLGQGGAETAVAEQADPGNWFHLNPLRGK